MSSNNVGHLITKTITTLQHLQLLYEQQVHNLDEANKCRLPVSHYKKDLRYLT